MASAVGEAHAATLVDESSFQAMVDDLLQNENTVGADFDAKHLTHWDDFLEMPFYKLHRDEAVRAISHTGARCLDIGSGLGYGLADLTRRVGADGIVVGVERSTDFMAQSLARLGGASPVRHVHADVEVGLQFLQTGFFDGAMIVGAFHFIRNREGLFSEVSRILRPGGRFCIGHGFVSRSSPDLEIMELRFATRAPIGHPVTDRELASLAREHGMRGPVRTHYTGCMGWFEFERPH
jgi:SAM-dependent methyltransferase